MSGKRIAIVQSNYIPWKGYFDLIGAVDTFVFYDTVQFTKNDWRNRNLICTQSGIRWVTVPVGQAIHRTIDSVTINDAVWQRKHWSTFVASYSKAPFFKMYRPLIEPLYLSERWYSLSALNQSIIRTLSKEVFKFSTEFASASDFNLQGGPTEKLVQLVLKLDGTSYLSGPSAKSYLDQTAFERSGITLEFANYAGYPEYSQRSHPFTHQVSALDLIWNTGDNSKLYLKGAADLCVPA
jgi:hypothetical protein